jgi:hypothetical protein
MLDFARKTFLGLSAALAMGSAMPAAAATLDGAGWTGDPKCTTGTGSSANTWATVNVLAGATFEGSFSDIDLGGNLCFNFANSSLVDAVVTFAVATVNQGGSIWGFRDGVQLVSEQLGNLWTVAEGADDSNSFTFLIAAGDTVFFDWIYGDPYGETDNLYSNIDFVVYASPVPLPAGGLLLIGAIGGLAALRRRKAA